jgi:predicted nucleic acid-binding protein
MTTAVVVDASAAITFLLRQRGVEAVDRRLEAWLAEGVDLSVPTHFWLEVSNVLIRRHRVTGSGVMKAIHQLDELNLATVPLDRPLLLLALDHAERFGLTTYDATYLALTELLDATVYTADSVLLAAAGSRGLGIEGASEHRLSENLPAYNIEQRTTWPDYSGASAYLAQLRSEAIRPG